MLVGEVCSQCNFSGLASICLLTAPPESPATSVEAGAIYNGMTDDAFVYQSVNGPQNTARGAVRRGGILQYTAHQFVP